MEAALNKITNIMTRNFSTSFNVSSDKSEITLKLSSSLKLDENYKYEMALTYFTTFNNISNVTSKNNQIIIYYDKSNTNGIIINIPEGAYELKEINKFLQDQIGSFEDGKSNIKKQRIELIPDLTTGKCKMILNNIEVDFTSENSLNSLLGFENKKYNTGFHLSEKIMDIIDIDTINIYCDLIYGGYSVDGIKNQIIYSFPSFSVPVGYKIIQFPNNLIYYQINKKTIDQIYFKIIDQKGNLISFNNQRINMNFHLRQIK